MAKEAKNKPNKTQVRESLKETWQQRLLRVSSLLQYLDEWSKRGKVRHLRHAVERYSALGISNMAATLSYYIIFALFPFAIFMAGLIAVLGGNFVTPEMVDNFKQMVPGQMRAILGALLQNVSSTATVTMASIGILALVWSASRGFSVLVYTMDLVYDNPRNPATYFIQQVLSLLITLAVGLAILLILLSMAFGSYVVKLINELLGVTLLNASMANYFNYAISFLLLSTIFSLLYYFSSKRKTKFRYAFSCGLACGLSWVLVSFLFSLYLQSSTRYSVIYGSLTGIIVLMFWLYLCSTALLIFGFVHSEIMRIGGERGNTQQPDLYAKLKDKQTGTGPVGLNVSAHHNRNVRLYRMGKRR